MELKEGYYDGNIVTASIIKSRFAKPGESALEVELECNVYDEAHRSLDETVKIYLELSANYPKFGDTTKPYWAQTMERLHSLGFQGDDLTSLATQLQGRAVRLNYRTTDKMGQPLKNGPAWYLSAVRVLEKVDANAANAILKQMMGQAVGATRPAASANPFDLNAANNAMPF